MRCKQVRLEGNKKKYTKKNITKNNLYVILI